MCVSKAVMEVDNYPKIARSSIESEAVRYVESLTEAKAIHPY